MARRAWGTKTCPHCGKPGIYNLAKHYPAFCQAARPMARPPAPAPLVPAAQRRPVGPATPAAAPPSPVRPLTAAEQRLLLEHRGLAAGIARRFRWTGLPLEDLQAAGELALARAAQAFDPARGVAFPTFAYRAVEGAMLEAARTEGGPVAISRGQTAQAIRGHLRAQPQADLEALARELGTSRRLVEAVRARMGTRGDRVLGEQLDLPDLGATPADEALDRGAQLKRLRQALPRLPSFKQQEIVRRRYFGERKESFTSIGRRFGRSGEWARTQEIRALMALRRDAFDEED